jgi:hypothetical protein
MLSVGREHPLIEGIRSSVNFKNQIGAFGELLDAVVPLDVLCVASSLCGWA